VNRHEHLREPALTGDQANRLRRALQAIVSVSDELNSAAHACKACGSRIREDLDQYQTKLRLEGVNAKIISILEADMLAWADKTRRRNNG
jgi:hypothetical protein